MTNYAEGIRALRRSLADAALEIFQPVPKISVSEWANEFRRLPSTSPIPGRFKTTRVPYMRRIQDVLGDESIQEVYFAKSSQIAGSTIGENFIGYLIDRSPCAILQVWPTEEKLKKWSLKRLDPMLMDSPVLKAKFPRTGRREPGDSIAYKEFPGGWLNAITAKSTSALKSDTARVAIAEEVDEWETDLDKQGDPLNLLLVRLRNFFNRKLYVVSTPTIAGQSRIWQLLGQSTWEEYKVPCPFCNGLQVLRWRDESSDGDEVGQYRFLFERDEHGDVVNGSTRYVCEHCNRPIEERWKTPMLAEDEVAGARWVPRFPGRKALGFHAWTAYSPFVQWDDICREFLKSNKQASTLKVFVNTWLGLPFQEEVQSIEPHTIASRAVPFPKSGSELLVPNGVGILTAFIDVQNAHGGWLDISIWGWGAEMRSWVYQWLQLEGDPGGPAVWQRAHEVITGPYRHEHGAVMRISATCVDCGYMADMAYPWAKARTHWNVIPTVGRSGRGRKLIEEPDLTRLRKTKSKKRPMYILGADSGKDLLASRLRLKDPKMPGYITVGNHIDQMFYEQITAEQLRTKYIAGRPHLVWDLPAGKRNEALDGAIGNMAALAYLGTEHIQRLAQYAQQISDAGRDGAPALQPQRRGWKTLSKGIEL